MWEYIDQDENDDGEDSELKQSSEVPMNPKESDWKLYSKLIPFWRDRYLQRRNHELVAILIQPES